VFANLTQQLDDILHNSWSGTAKKSIRQLSAGQTIKNQQP